jgi:Ca-activated chloride channel family protein
MTNEGLYTKDGGGVPLRGVEVTGEVLGGHAQVTVRQRYQNAETKPVEAVYTFPLPSDATLSGFAMTCDGRRLDGVVKEREEAFRDYDDALFNGHGAALLEQERPNVFTASVGNLLPGEETVIEVTYLQRLPVDEGALRWSIPTLVAPRYIPGKPVGDRTADGWSNPTDQVPDADRITPRAGKVDYGLTLDLVFDLGAPVEVESPSHDVEVQPEGSRTRVRFRQGEVALDRDVVLIARGGSGTGDARIESVIAHRPAAGPCYLALTVVPDLAGEGTAVPPQDVVFVIDTSGSMSGASLPQAQAALRLCLRHLRQGDRFNVIAFNTDWQGFAQEPVPFTQDALEQADRWVEALEATGGTEMLAPLVAAVRSAPDGIVVLLTDGQVGNEAAILAAVLEARGKARLYSLGIGTNVSDMLLRDLARQTGGAVELIYPGERIDDKVVAQFARAIAPRVSDVKVSFREVQVSERAPEEPPALIDGEPWVMLAKIEGGERGRAIVTGRRDGKPFKLEVPIDLAGTAGTIAAMERPVVSKLWARERVRDLTDAMRTVGGQRRERLKERIVALAVEHGLSTPYTAFVVVETRTGDRKATGVPATRVVPVNVPAGWEMFHQQSSPGLSRRMMAAPATYGRPQIAAMGMTRGGGSRGGGGMFAKATAFLGGGGNHDGGHALAMAAAGAPAFAASFEPAAPEPPDPVRELLQRQLASGLWGDSTTAGEPLAQLRATTEALFELLRAGVDTSHNLYGVQVKKAVAALARLAATLAGQDRALAERAVEVAWLASSGRRTRREVEDVVAGDTGLAGLGAQLGDERALRARLGV